MNDIAIKDHVIVPEPIIVKSISINVMSMIFSQSVTLQVYMYSKTNENIKVMVDQKIILVEGEEYTAWGNDDTYLENLVFSKLGLEKADEIQIINELATTNEITISDESATTNEINVSYERPITNEINVSYELAITNEINVSDESATTNEINVSDETTITNEP